MGQDIRAPEVIDDEATHASANSTTASSVSVSLGYRLRSRGLQTTRTQRALVRMYSRDEYTVHQIGEYMNLTPSAIWAAIRNEAGDNLDEDRGYCDGIVGDVINVDAVDIRDLQSDREAQAEELEVEKVLQGDARTSCATHEDPDSDLEVIGLWPTSLVRPKKMGTRERQRQPRTSRPGPLTSPGPSQFTSVASMGARRSLPRASGKSSKMKQRGVEQTSIASPAEVRASQPSPVRAFLGELAYPLGRLGDAIIAFGITTNLELDVFSGMREEWVLLQAFLFEKHGVTPLEWIVLKSGLEARAAKQNTH
ncbi:hypothetical protein FOMPIDRAFT_1022382 [Fomitopsis schrenkii]|uniref:Uncharacterized protein n=1 Tax=Fomitopsis schrenkii TaxID=2126942 RepID=S8FYU6_FOMSC|nr:hypothetical protein FOMPIDRAFT_1022382 [Fomitopsis schrenkii]